MKTELELREDDPSHQQLLPSFLCEFREDKPPFPPPKQLEERKLRLK